ncbi:MAG: site-specific integrase [Firmicutes bacterium]|nr:site-specific integrase [Bacillota bacterium]
MTLTLSDTTQEKISFFYDPNLSEETLSSLAERGIINANEYHRYIWMAKKDKINNVHTHAITQGTGKDRRWFTNVRDPKTGKRKRVAGNTEEDVYQKLYEFYFAREKEKQLTLEKLYPEWLRYRVATVGKANTAHRQDTDYRRYYLNEPLSKHLITTPVAGLTRAEIKQWECVLVKKYQMTYKTATNVFSILRQMMDYLVDRDLIDRNIAREIHLDRTIYRTVCKAPAETQIFYPDEIEYLMKLCYQKAKETEDENYLAIPLIRQLGIRIGECLALSFSDFDAKTHKVHIHRSLSVQDELLPDGTWAKRQFEVEDSLKKGSPPRDILVTDVCFDLIKKIRAMLFKKGIIRDRIFETASESNIQLKLYRMCDELDFGRRSPHKLRKTYISMLLNNSFDPDFVRRQAGHRQLQTTLNNYTYSTTRDDVNVEKLNQVLAL